MALYWPANAGAIRVIDRGNKDKRAGYRMKVNRNHQPATQFTTIAHELGHLFLGHVGANKSLNIPERRRLSYSEVELEAESVAYLVCERHGISVKSESYLTHFVSQETSLTILDLYQIMRAAGQVTVARRFVARLIYADSSRQTNIFGNTGLKVCPSVFSSRSPRIVSSTLFTYLQQSGRIWRGVR